MFGFLNIDKPRHRTSREAVDAVQRLVRPDRVGHAGTLDPMATGVLILCIGPATRLTKYVQQMAKTYVADFRLGQESDTDDIFGKLVDLPAADIINESKLADVLPEFVGKIMQLPPKFSAIHVNGERAYRLARKGKPVELAPRPVLIHEISLRFFRYPDFQIEIRCGSGTYVRSIGRDIGRMLGSGAVMRRLERTALGSFESQHGISSDDITLEKLEKHLIGPREALAQMPTIDVPDSQLELFANGHTWSTVDPPAGEDAAAIDESGRLLTILKQRKPGFFTPAINFSKYWLEQQSNQQSGPSGH